MASIYCNFGANLKDNMRDQFVFGVSSETLQNNVDYVSGKKSFNEKATCNKGHVNKKCFCCGKANHVSSECRFKTYKCNVYQKQGHLKAVCKLNKNLVNNKDKKNDNFVKSKQNVNYNYLKENQNQENWSSDLDNLYAFRESPIEVIKTVKPYDVEIKVENVTVKFKINTGSPITAFS